ncbi:MAG: SMC-Scp complex subunit ScpB [Candidatus Micrarchaeota archaeon]
MTSEKRLIEAALFISARPMKLEELRTLTGIGALGYLRKTLEKLRDDYAQMESAIEIIEMDGRYEMRVRSEYTGQVRQFAQDAEISKAALRTLAYIAKNDGVLKSLLAKKIGSSVYQDVKELAEAGFVKPKKAGRSSKLFLTEKFKRYFEMKKGAPTSVPVSLDDGPLEVTEPEPEDSEGAPPEE